jgi:hypothetical protein
LKFTVLPFPETCAPPTITRLSGDNFHRVCDDTTHPSCSHAGFLERGTCHHNMSYATSPISLDSVSTCLSLLLQQLYYSLDVRSSRPGAVECWEGFHFKVESFEVSILICVYSTCLPSLQHSPVLHPSLPSNALARPSALFQHYNTLQPAQTSPPALSVHLNAPKRALPAL